MGEKRNPYISRRLVRGLRKFLPVDGTLPEGRSLPPDVIVLVPTLRCSLRCPYCFQGDRDRAGGASQVSGELDLAAWQAVIDDVQPRKPNIVVMGGELFLYPEALALLRAIKAADLHLTLITNGIALPRVAGELVEMGLNQLIVSIDGPPKVHNVVRGNPQAYKLAAEGIRRVVTARGICPGPSVQASCAVSVHTQAHLTAFVAAVSSLGVDRIVFNSLIYATAEQVSAQRQVLRQAFGLQQYGAVLDHGAQLGVDPALVRREMATIRAGAWSQRVVVAPPGAEQHPEAYYAPHAPPFHGQTCRAIYRELWILPNGDVVPCTHMHDLVMGNVREAGAMAVWNSTKFRRFRQYLAQGPLPACVRCEKLTYHHPPRPTDSRISS